MAKYSIDAPEKREQIQSRAIERLCGIADKGEVQAFSIRRQHPRFKNRYSDPHFYVKFKQNGVVYTADGSSPEALDAEIESLYF